MIAFSRWCVAHRRWVVVTWIVVAIAATAIANAVGRQYSNNWSLPGTQAQEVVNLLSSQFKAQSGDIDTLVWSNARGSFDAPAVKAAIVPLLQRVSHMPHVEGVISPFSAAGARAVSPDGSTAFATINYDNRANLLPDATGKPVLNAVKAIRVPGLSVAAGGQVMENAEGFSVGPATTVGVIAAMLILLLTFGSLVGAGMPMVTAGLGLITGIAFVGLATHVTDMSNVAPELAIMIGLGVGIDYALFIVTRFRENYARVGDVEQSVLQAMDTSGRAILLAGTTVIIALLGMFATGVAFMYGLSIASILAVLLVLTASLTLLPAMLSKFGERIAQPSRFSRRARGAGGTAGADARERTAWRRWSLTVQAHPRGLAAGSLIVMIVFLSPVFVMRLQSSDAGNDPSATSTRQAFDLLSHGFGPGFNGPLLVAVKLSNPNSPLMVPAIEQIRDQLIATPDVVAVGPPQIAPSGAVAILEAYPGSAPQAVATTNLVNHLRDDVLPPLSRSFHVTALVGGLTAGSIDFSHVLASKLPLFIAIVVVVSALLLAVLFRSLVIPLQAGLMNLLSIGGALGATVAVFQKGILAGLLGVDKAPIEPWIPVLMFAVVFGLSMDYEVFLISRVREEWVRQRDASAAVADGIAYTGRVITAAAAIMVCVFLSFMLGNERPIKEFGFGLAAAVFLDAVVVRCVMLPAVLELLGRVTWALPAWLDARLPHFRIEGAQTLGGQPPAPEEEPALV
jgi:RND superfamily putative drug exporter